MAHIHALGDAIRMKLKMLQLSILLPKTQSSSLWIQFVCFFLG